MRDIKEPVCGLSSMPSDQDLKKPGRGQAWWLIHDCGSRTQEAEERESWPCLKHPLTYPHPPHKLLKTRNKINKILGCFGGLVLRQKLEDHLGAMLHRALGQCLSSMREQGRFCLTPKLAQKAGL